MDKAHILSEIKRTAQENGGTPLGRVAFQRQTGIRETDWSGKHWARWSDAVKEAGLPPNQLNQAYPREVLLDRYASLVRELGRLPTTAELKLRARADSTFPSHNTFRRLGKGREEIAAALHSYCEGREGFEDVVVVCGRVAPVSGPPEPLATSPASEESGWGSVYLAKSGRYYKIGRSNSVGRRHYELSIQLPDPLDLVHVIRTDDPAGIEQYWHRRFEAKRRNGEWFSLSADDLSAFKRRKFM